MDHVKWEDVALIIRAIAFLSEQAWVIQSLSKGQHSLLTSKLSKNDEHDPLANERMVISSLLKVFRRPILERWFSIRFWAMDAIRNMVGHRPGKELVRILVEEGASEAFETLFSTPSSDPTSPNGRRSTTASPRGSAFSKSNSGSIQSATSLKVRSGPDGNGKLRAELMEEYRREASKRAEELVMYISIWDRVADEEATDIKANKRLTVVSIAGMGGGLEV